MRELRWAFLALIPAALGGGLLLASGLILGFVLVPASPAGIFGLTPLTALVGIHHLGGFLLAVFAGLFLFWTIRSLGTPETTVLAGAAIALGVLSATESAFFVDAGIAALYLTAASLGLWVLVYAASLLRIRRRGVEGRRKPTAA